MSTISSTGSTQHHSFPTSVILAAASAVVVVGGLTAYGVSVAHDDATTTPAQTHAKVYTHQMCTDIRCLPPEQKAPRGGSHNSRSIEETLPTGTSGRPSFAGGRTQIGLT